MSGDSEECPATRRPATRRPATRRPALRIVAGLLIAYCIIFALSFLFPREVRLERSIRISCSPEIVVERFARLEEWVSWVPWLHPAAGVVDAGPMSSEVKFVEVAAAKEMKPERRLEWKLASGEEGFVSMHSDHPPHVVPHRMEISEGIYRLEGELRVEPSAEGESEVVWALRCRTENQLLRYGSPFVERFLGREMEAFLSALRKASEASEENEKDLKEVKPENPQDREEHEE